MNNTFVGLIAVVAGLLFCFRGFLALRTLIALWGGFVGFAVGVALTGALASGSVLGSGLSWVVALVVAILFAGLAYAFYAIGIILTAGSTGYLLGVGLGAALGVGGWPSTLFGLAGAAILALLALATNLPKLLLVLFSASVGAGATLVGALMLAGVVDLDQMAAESWTTLIREQWWWDLAYLALFVAGAISQWRFGTAHDVRSAYGRPTSGARPTT
ncbi:MAG: DUF4203 domain-containing protein [Actinomycetes bacterium]